MSQTALRDEICRVGRSLFERGYVHATAGNSSVRLDDGGFLITPTDACLGHLEAQRLAHVSPDGEALGGDRASKTLALHRLPACRLSARCRRTCACGCSRRAAGAVADGPVSGTRDRAGTLARGLTRATQGGVG